MANSYVFYPSETGARTDYSVPYEYLSSTFVKATVNGASVPFTFLSTYMIRFTTAPVGALKIYRETAKGPVNTYINGSILVDSQLNGSFLQSLHVSEEVSDNAMVTGIDGAWDAANLKIKNLANPTNPQDAVNKRWAEDVGSGFVGSAGASAAAAAASAAQALADKNIVATDKGIVAADKATVAADKATTLGYKNAADADKVATAADRVQTGADRVQTGADRATVNTDKGIVAADKATVAADRATVNTDKGIVAADKATVNTDKGIVAADKATVAADKATTITARDTAQKWATEVEDTQVSGGLYSAYHWARKAMAYVAGALGTQISGLTAKNTPVSADKFVLADSANGWTAKSIDWNALSLRILSQSIPDASLNARLGLVAKTITDWNDALDNGWYMGSASANAPSATWFIGNVEAHGAAGYRTQTVHGFTTASASDTVAYRRHQGGGVWGAWYKLLLSQTEQDARYLRLFADANLGAGFTSAYVGDGVKSGGVVYNALPTSGNFRLVQNGGAFTWQADPDVSSKSYTLVVILQNTATAGAVSFSNFSLVDGDALTTTNTALFVCTLIKHGGVKTISIRAL
jgi:hypothetical protein